MHGTFSIGKPSYLKSFSYDLAILFRDHFLSKGALIYWNNVLEECQVYAMDICLHFKKESGGLLPEDWLKHMVAEVYDTMLKLFPESADKITFDKFLSDIKSYIEFGIARSKIDNYYSKFK